MGFAKIKTLLIRRAAWPAGAVLAAVLALGAARLAWRRAERTPAMRGAEIARRAGCFACHGAEGAGGVGDPSSTAGTVPGWDGGAVAMYVKSEAEFREWILDGASKRERAQKGPAGPAPLMAMPAYKGVLSAREVDDVVAYLKARSGWDPDIPDKAYEGRKAAVRLGCFGCHGPSGQGGAANPRSPLGFVAPWTGRHFARFVRDDDELREWILDGRSRRLEANFFARFVLSRQAIKMPAYRPYLRGDELDNLVAYIRRLRTPRR